MSNDDCEMSVVVTTEMLAEILKGAVREKFGIPDDRNVHIAFNPDPNNPHVGAVARFEGSREDMECIEGKQPNGGYITPVMKSNVLEEGIVEEVGEQTMRTMDKLFEDDDRLIAQRDLANKKLH